MRCVNFSQIVRDTRSWLNPLRKNEFEKFTEKVTRFLSRVFVLSKLKNLSFITFVNVRKIYCNLDIISHFLVNVSLNLFISDNNTRFIIE